MAVSEINFPHKSSALLPSFNLAQIADSELGLWILECFSHSFIVIIGGERILIKNSSALRNPQSRLKQLIIVTQESFATS